MLLTVASRANKGRWWAFVVVGKRSVWVEGLVRLLFARTHTGAARICTEEVDQK